MTRSYRFSTKAIHSGQEPEPATGAVITPIFATSTFVQPSPGINKGYEYSRSGNPTRKALEQCIADLENGTRGFAFSSGLAASSTVLELLPHGSHILSINDLYGGTFRLFERVRKNSAGIETTYIDFKDIDTARKAIRDTTRLIWVETPTNPLLKVVDLEQIASLARDHGLISVCDNTFATPYIQKPLELGFDIVVHSATKYIGGHGTSIGGVLIDSGKFDWAASGKFPGLTEPDPSYNNITYVEAAGPAAYIVKARVQLLRDIGACLSPFNSFLFLQGLETLSLRVERHVFNAKKIADFLQSHELVSWVNYPSLKDNKYYNLAQKYLPKGVGSIFTFGIKGGLEAGKRFIDNLQLFSLLANVADAKSLVIHPASTTHAQLSEAEQRDAGVTPDMVRLSIGLEDVQDLIDDLDQALYATK